MQGSSTEIVTVARVAPASSPASLSVDRQRSSLYCTHRLLVCDRPLAGPIPARERPIALCVAGPLGPPAAGAYGDERCLRRSVTVVLPRAVPRPDRQDDGRSRRRPRTRRAGGLAARL